MSSQKLSLPIYQTTQELIDAVTKSMHSAISYYEPHCRFRIMPFRFHFYTFDTQVVNNPAFNGLNIIQEYKRRYDFHGRIRLEKPCGRGLRPRVTSINAHISYYHGPGLFMCPILIPYAIVANTYIYLRYRNSRVDKKLYEYDITIDVSTVDVV
jgi:hypothetical protein